MTQLSITIKADEPMQGPRAPRPLKNAAREKNDAVRRPQAALLYRALKAAEHRGLSWRECWALSAEEDWVVGPIVVWLRSHGVDVNAVYDVVAGETRFYLITGSIASGD